MLPPPPPAPLPPRAGPVGASGPGPRAQKVLRPKPGSQGGIPGAWPRDAGADSGRNSVSFFVFKRNSPCLAWAGPSFIWFSSKAEPRGALCPVMWDGLGRAGVGVRGRGGGCAGPRPEPTVAGDRQG